MLDKEILKPYLGRMVSWLVFEPSEAHIVELEEFYLKEIKETSGGTFLILEQTTRRQKCVDCPLLDDRDYIEAKVVETAIVPLKYVIEIKFYQAGI